MNKLNCQVSTLQTTTCANPAIQRTSLRSHLAVEAAVEAALHPHLFLVEAAAVEAALLPHLFLTGLALVMDLLVARIQVTLALPLLPRWLFQPLVSK